MQVVVVRCAEADVAEFTACTVAAHFMANRIVCPLADAGGLPEGQHAHMTATLGVFTPTRVGSDRGNPCFAQSCIAYKTSTLTLGTSARTPKQPVSCFCPQGATRAAFVTERLCCMDRECMDQRYQGS